MAESGSFTPDLVVLPVSTRLTDLRLVLLKTGADHCWAGKVGIPIIGLCYTFHAAFVLGLRILTPTIISTHSLTFTYDEYPRYSLSGLHQHSSTRRSYTKLLTFA